MVEDQKMSDISELTDKCTAGLGIQDFTLLKVVGVGSYGRVMLVRKNDTGELLAMKMLRKEHLIKRNQVEHTKTERRVLETVKHPFIVQLRYAFQNPKKLYFLLEYCPGGELFFHLQKAGHFDEERYLLSTPTAPSSTRLKSSWRSENCTNMMWCIESKFRSEW